MDLNEWSFVLSIVGLVLGVVSAYPQLRGAARRALRFGADGANRLLSRLYAQADFYIAYPSALVAYIAKSTFILATVLWLSIQFLRPDSPTYLPFPSWLQLALSLGVTFTVGKIGGDLLNILRLVVHRAKQLHTEASSGG